MPDEQEPQLSDLQKYPKPSVAVDVAVLTLDDTGRQLQVLQVYRGTPTTWGLPGRILRERELLVDAVKVALREKAGVEGLNPQQLKVFDAGGRDDRGWVLSVAHLDVVRQEQLAERFADTTRLVAVDDPQDLPWDHPLIIKEAVEFLRPRYERAADPNGLLGDTFTMRELQWAHEAVAGRELQRDNFRRAMDDFVEETAEPPVTRGRGRPAVLYRRRPQL